MNEKKTTLWWWGVRGGSEYGQELDKKGKEEPLLQLKELEEDLTGDNKIVLDEESYVYHYDMTEAVDNNVLLFGVMFSRSSYEALLCYGKQREWQYNGGSSGLQQKMED